MLILIRHIEARPRARREPVIAAGLGELAAGHVQLLNAGEFREGEFVGREADDGAVLGMGAGDGEAAVSGDFVEGEPFGGEFGEEGAGDVPEGGEEEVVDYLGGRCQSFLWCAQRGPGHGYAN